MIMIFLHYVKVQLSLISDRLELYDVSEGTLIFVIDDVFAVTDSILWWR